MKQETEKLILKKAETKKDGCYRFRGVAYKVKDFEVTHYADCGVILQRSYGFNVNVGSYPFSMYSDEVGQALLRKLGS